MRTLKWEDIHLADYLNYYRSIKPYVGTDEYGTKAIINTNQAYLKLERQALELRNCIPRVNFIKRKVFTILMLLRGNYRFFNGYKSFFRDLIR